MAFSPLCWQDVLTPEEPKHPSTSLAPMSIVSKRYLAGVGPEEGFGVAQLGAGRIRAAGPVDDRDRRAPPQDRFSNCSPG